MAQNGHSSHHVAPAWHYVGVFLGLIGLTGVTYLAATIDMGALNTPVALIIAFFKASLVVMIFMEIRNARPLTRLSVITGIAFLVILLIFTFGDYFGRTMVPLEEGWRKDGPHTVGTVPDMFPEDAAAQHAPAKAEHAPAKH